MSVKLTEIPIPYSQPRDSHCVEDIVSCFVLNSPLPNFENKRRVSQPICTLTLWSYLYRVIGDGNKNTFRTNCRSPLLLLVVNLIYSRELGWCVPISVMVYSNQPGRQTDSQRVS